MSENLRYWDQLSKTDPDHTKPITNRPGGFRGTAVKPIWIQRRLTETFGPCGIGWGSHEPWFRTMETDGQIAVYCVLRCWYKEGDTTGEVFGIGGDTVTKFKDGKLWIDDEAFKKAFTDALGNAFKHIGVAADIHMGQFDDSKYVNAVRKEFDDAETAKPSTPPSLGPDLEAFAKRSGHTRAALENLAFSQADRGTEVFREWWKSITEGNKKLLDSIIPELKNRAKYADDKMLPRVDVVKVNGKPDWEATTKALVAEVVGFMTVEECEGFDELNAATIKMLKEYDRNQYDAYKMVTQSHVDALMDQKETA